MIACTGRPFPGALPWVERLGLAGPIICYQGAQVRNLDGSVLLDHGIAHQVAMEVIRFAREHKLHVQAYRDDQLIVEHDREEAQIYARHAGMQVHVVRDLDAAMGETKALNPTRSRRLQSRIAVNSAPLWLRKATFPGCAMPAANVALARNAAGIHWRSDGIEGLKLGETVALGVLSELRACVHEDFG